MTRQRRGLWLRFMKNFLNLWYNDFKIRKGKPMQGQKMTLSYEKRAILENFFTKFIDWVESGKKDKKQIVDEAVNTFETMMQANALSVKELNQRVVDETLHELATKDFVRAEIAGVRTELKAEIAEVRAEIADLKVKGLYWLIGTAFVSIATTIGAVFTMMTYMLDRLT